MYGGVALLIAAGAVSGVMGVLFALSGRQHDLKRSSGLSQRRKYRYQFLSAWAWDYRSMPPAPISWQCSDLPGRYCMLVNTWRLFKGLFVHGRRGRVYRQTRNARNGPIGGSTEKMPITGTTFLIGAVAISGLPPLKRIYQ